MVLNIGIDCNGEDWRASLLENGRTLELRPLNDVRAALEYVRHICSFYPEPVIAVSARISVFQHLLPPFYQAISKCTTLS